MLLSKSRDPVSPGYLESTWEFSLENYSFICLQVINLFILSFFFFL